MLRECTAGKKYTLCQLCLGVFHLLNGFYYYYSISKSLSYVVLPVYAQHGSQEMLNRLDAFPGQDGITVNLNRALVLSGLVLHMLVVFITCCLGFFVLPFGCSYIWFY